MQKPRHIFLFKNNTLDVLLGFPYRNCINAVAQQGSKPRAERARVVVCHLPMGFDA